MHASGVLSTSDLAGNPHGAVVYFALHDDFTLTFATKTETQKYKNIEENSSVAFVVYHEKEQTSVQIFGQAKLITDPEERHEVLAYMYNTSPKLSLAMLPPAEKLDAGDYVAIRLKPQVIKMAIYSRYDEDRDDLFEIITLSEP